MVDRGVGGDDPLPLVQDVVDDGARDPHPLAGVLDRPPPADRPGGQRPLVVEEQDRAAVGPDRVEDELEDLRQQGVGVEDVADRPGRAVHHREVGQADLEPFAGRFGRGHPLGDVDRRQAPDDRRAVLGPGHGQHVDAVGQVVGRDLDGVEEQQGGADLHAVAAPEGRLLDRLAVDEGAVGRPEVDDPVAALAVGSDLGVVPRDLVVVQEDRAGTASTQRGRPRREGVALPPVGPLNDEQRRHGVDPPGRGRGPPACEVSDRGQANGPAAATSTGRRASGPPGPVFKPAA